ncbi:hypothetical protein ACFPOE_21925 [Caenimonas terrae]|uniref:Uncharacterized protein n=1 Tax=Caenimonas terrae TaxID=696074 RepID=A0ABW0NJH6_9BURK
MSSEALTLAVYFVQWTLGAPEHTPNIDLVLGKWGDGVEAQERVLVSLLYRPAPSGGSFMVIDGEGRHSNRQAICGRGLGRAEVIGTPLAGEVFALVDAIWLTDPRISEVKELDNAA